jgi:hypothetical protein
MSSISFVLNTFSHSYTMSTLGTLDQGETLAVGDVSAIAVYYISQTDINKVFRFESDSWDMTDISSADIRYFTYMNQWPTSLKINPANAMLDKNTAQGAMLQVGIANKMLVKHDFVRYLSKSLFNTAQGADLFNNEEALIGNLNDVGAQSFSDISATLWTYSTGNTSIADNINTVVDLSSNALCTTNNFIGQNNVARELFQQVLGNSPGRFNTVVQDGNGQAAIPILDGDTISYKFTVAPAPGQHNLTGVSAFGPRVYQIKLLVVADATGLNTLPVD